MAVLSLVVPWAVYGTSSAFHTFMNAEGAEIDPMNFDPFAYTREQLLTKPAKPLHDLRLAMLTQGVDLSGWPGGLVSGVHQEEEIEATATAFRQSLRMLRSVAKKGSSDTPMSRVPRTV